MVTSRRRTRVAPARRQAFGRALFVMFWVLAIDQASKHTIGSSIQPGQSKTLIPGVLHLVYVRNHGVAFGFLGGGGALVFVLEGVALLALVAYLAARPDQRWLWLPTGMLLGGAIGNLIDRVTMGSVIDFIKLPDWPAFNLADASITFGVIILVLAVEAGRSSDRDSEPD